MAFGNELRRQNMSENNVLHYASHLAYLSTFVNDYRRVFVFHWAALVTSSYIVGITSDEIGFVPIKPTSLHHTAKRGRSFLAMAVDTNHWTKVTD